MNVKEETYERTLSFLRKELGNLNFKKKITTREINRLTKEQRIIKSQIGELLQLINSLNTKK